jgi:hypothetical protein
VGKVDDLVVDSELLSVVGDDEDTDGSGSTSEGLLEARPEVALVNDLKTLLNLTGLGHGNKLSVIADVDETVLLEDRSEKGVEDDGRRGVRDNTRLLVKLLGEEVNSEVTVLASLSRGGDADDLARAVLEDDEVTNADVVARDGEGGSLRSVDRGDGLGLVGRVLVGGVGDGSVLVGVVVAGVGGLVLVGVRVVLAHFVGGFVGDGRG